MKKHILIIDHERLLCDGLKKALSQENVEVDTASSYSEAIELLRSNNYDLCLLDIRLADEDGFEMIEVVKHFCPNMQIILMTTSDLNRSGSHEKIEKANKQGVGNFLCKPFDLKKLHEVITVALLENADDKNKSWFAENFTVNTRRREKREKRSAEIQFFISVINDGEVKRRSFTAESVDISDGGLGLITPYILRPEQVISFDGDLGRRSGVVVWSSLRSDQRCRVGIRFA